ncbi:zinc-ribbon domain-containing protein [Bacillus toyonensis]|uniref:zinc-ribbon domain-containing protein n=1 Tax=Bacillus toyonensis TaxID=155322 RepID=UPI000BEBAEEE|nr:zinc-ribbon domain-containing protein [Bacillus toyonensis]PEF81414.1 hypothetical protein CON80_10015 [Bacillus toyonensis]
MASQHLVNYRKEKLKLLQEIAKKKGGKCLSTEYKNVKTHMLWECKNRHQFKKTSHSVEHIEHWCDECYLMENSLQVKYPEIASLWNGELNNGISPEHVTIGVKGKYWWNCPSCNNTFQRTPHQLTKSKLCTNCSNQKGAENRIQTLIQKSGSLLEKYPDIAKEWHPEKNNPLIASNVTPSSAQIVWWYSKTCGHEWQAGISDRTRIDRPQHCAVCAKNKRVQTKMENDIRKRGSLQDHYPALAEEWHPTKNSPLHPSDVLSFSNRKVWWVCKEGHEWPAEIDSRSSQGNGCPYCSGLFATYETSFGYLFPDLLKEWHPTENQDIDPFFIKPQSHIRASWQCLVCHHHWKTYLSNRTDKNSGCPKCKSSTSINEQTIYFYMDRIFDQVENRKVVSGSEIDVYIPSLQLGIEYDGFYYHKNKKKNDEHKNKKLEELGIQLIRIREHAQSDRLPDLNKSNTIVIDFDYSSNRRELIKPLCAIASFIMSKYKEQLTSNEIIGLKSLWKVDIEKDESVILGMILRNREENSFAAKYPHLLKDWHLTKNGDINPKNFSSGSNVKVWWLCHKCGHEWKNSFSSRTNKHKGDGCYKCGRKITSTKLKLVEDYEQSLEFLYPEIAKDWVESEGKLLSSQVSPNSKEMVVWKCHNGHEVENRVMYRVRTNGCPKCKGTVLTDVNNLQFLYPDIAKEWHYEKNHPLTPRNVRAKSGKLVWWKCEKDHKFQAYISNRTKREDKCPYCSGKKPTKENCLTSKRPHVASYWHPERNNDLTPYDILPYSNKKYWWKCRKCHHEWNSRITKRDSGELCPLCKKK